MKRALQSVLIMVVIAAALTAFDRARAYQLGDDYPIEYNTPSQDAVVDCWNFYNRECTSFVAWCLNSRNGIPFSNQYALRADGSIAGSVRWGYANHWGVTARELGYAVDRDPKVGSVYWSTSGSTGHVAWVSKVEGTHVWIEQYNVPAGSGMFSTSDFDLNDGSASGVQFIHIADIEAPAETTYASVDYASCYIRSSAFDERTVGYLCIDGSANAVVTGYSDQCAFSLSSVQTDSLQNGYKLTPFGSSNLLGASGITPGGAMGQRVEDWSNACAQTDDGCGHSRWLFELVGNRYVIHSKNNPSLVLTVDGHNVVMRPCSGSIWQQWEVVSGAEDPTQVSNYVISYYKNIPAAYDNPIDYLNDIYRTEYKHKYQDYTIINDTPARSDYIFLGWSTDESATSADPRYAPGSTYAADAPLHLWAVWSRDLQAGALSPDSAGAGGDGWNYAPVQPTYAPMTTLRPLENQIGSIIIANSFATASPDDSDENDAITGAFNNAHSHHRYRVFDVESVTSWDEAMRYCYSLGGHLATITSPEEDAFVYYSVLVPSGHASAYFGFTDADSEGEWQWCTGEPVTYTNWGDGEPNNESTENYGMYYYKYSDGKWNDGDFGGHTENGGTAFICEWDDAAYEIDETDAAVAPSATNVPASDQELARYLGLNAEAAAAQIGNLSEIAAEFSDEVPLHAAAYTNDGLMIFAMDIVDEIRIINVSDYTLCGVAFGMDVGIAQAAANAWFNRNDASASWQDDNGTLVCFATFSGAEEEAALELEAQDGIVKCVIWSHPHGGSYYIPSVPALIPGDRGENVKRLQRRLVELGYLDANQVDGAYGDLTSHAIWSFQEANGLLVTGYADGNTQSALYGDAAKRNPAPASASGIYLGTMYIVNCNEWVAIRPSPDTNAFRITEVPKGAAVEAYYYDSEFSECDYMGIHGYILNRYLASEAEEPSSQTAADPRAALELWPYLSRNIAQAAAEIGGLTRADAQFVDEVPMSATAYTDGALVLFGFENIESIEVHGASECTLCGISVGMDINSAINVTNAWFAAQGMSVSWQDYDDMWVCLVTLPQNGDDVEAALELDVWNDIVTDMTWAHTVGGSFSIIPSPSITAAGTAYSTIQKGDNGSAVEELQRRLSELDYCDASNIDGQYGSITASAVMSFQIINGLAVTGIHLLLMK